jgi:hypothetical protein
MHITILGTWIRVSMGFVDDIVNTDRDPIFKTVYKALPERDLDLGRAALKICKTNYRKKVFN